MHEDLLVKLESAKIDDKKMHILIEEYMPFIKSEVYKSKSIDLFEVDDLISVAMSAFKESVDKYDENLGNFISFASRIINLRLIDYYRSHLKFKNEILDNVASSNTNKSIVELGLEKKSIDEFSQTEVNLLRREEILEFKEELLNFGIDLKKLEKSSSKKKEIRIRCYEIASFIINDDESYNKLLNRKIIETENICSNFDINKKKLERLRAYIIAIVIILKGDYIFIRDYVSWRWLCWEE